MCTHTHTYTSLISAIKGRRKRKCLVAMIFLNWVNSKHDQSKMKINDYLFFFLPYCFFSHMDGKDLPSNKHKIKMALSLQSFNFPQIWSKFSERTQKTAVLHKWKSIELILTDLLYWLQFKTQLHIVFQNKIITVTNRSRVLFNFAKVLHCLSFQWNENFLI